MASSKIEYPVIYRPSLHTIEYERQMQQDNITRYKDNFEYKTPGIYYEITENETTVIVQDFGSGSLLRMKAYKKDNWLLEEYVGIDSNGYLCRSSSPIGRIIAIDNQQSNIEQDLQVWHNNIDNIGVFVNGNKIGEMKEIKREEKEEQHPISKLAKQVIKILEEDDNE